MVDTVRTLAALQTLLADNTSGDISPQDIRDFLVSVYPGGDNAGLLAYTQYRPGTDTTNTITSATLVDLDATNLAVAFTAPTSGAVLVRLSVLTRMGTDGQVGYWGLRDGTTTVAGSEGRVTQSNSLMRVTYQTVITGLTSSSALTWKWAARRTGGNFDHFYGGNSPFGPALMEIWAA